MEVETQNPYQSPVKEPHHRSQKDFLSDVKNQDLRKTRLNGSSESKKNFISD